MTGKISAADLWAKLPMLDDAELGVVAGVATAVCADEAGIATADLDMPHSALVHIVSEFASEESLGLAQGRIEELASDPVALRALTLSVLSAIPPDSELARDIAAAYSGRQRLMFLDGGISLGLGLLVLAIKLKKVQIGKGGGKVEFHQMTSGGLRALAGLIGH